MRSAVNDLPMKIASANQNGCHPDTERSEVEGSAVAFSCFRVDDAPFPNEVKREKTETLCVRARRKLLSPLTSPNHPHPPPACNGSFPPPAASPPVEPSPASSADRESPPYRPS